MADFNWNTFWQGTLTGITQAIAPSQQAPAAAPTAPKPVAADMMPILLVAGLGLALFLVLRK